MYEMYACLRARPPSYLYKNHTFLIFEFMYLCNPNIQKEEMYDSSYISYIGTSS